MIKSKFALSELLEISFGIFGMAVPICWTKSKIIDNFLKLNIYKFQELSVALKSN